MAALQFVANFVETAKGRAMNLTKSLSGYIAPAIKTGGTYLKNRLSSSIPKMDNLIACFTHNPDIVADVWAESSSFRDSIESFVDHSVVIERDVADSFINAFNAVGDGSAVVVDNLGHPFSFYSDMSYVDIKELVDQGITPLITTSKIPEDITDCLLYVKEGEVHFNNLVRSSNYVRRVNGRLHVDVLTYYDAFAIFAMLQGVRVTDVEPNIMALIHAAFAETEYDPSTLSEAFTDFYQFYEIPWDEYHEWEDVDFLEHFKEILVTRSYGSVASIFDVLDQLVETSTAHQMMYDILDNIDNITSSADLNTFLDSYDENKYSGVVQNAQQIRRAYTRGGGMGVLSYIINLFRDKASFTTDPDDDSSLILTDNSSMIPTSLVADVWSVVAEAASAIGQAIYQAAKGVIGFVFGIVKGVVGLFQKGYNAASSSTRAAINNAASVACAPMLPFALCGVIMNSSLINNADFMDAIRNGERIALSVPGGFLLTGRAVADASKLLVEFHPSVNSMGAQHEEEAFISGLSDSDHDYLPVLSLPIHAVDDASGFWGHHDPTITYNRDTSIWYRVADEHGFPYRVPYHHNVYDMCASTVVAFSEFGSDQFQLDQMNSEIVNGDLGCLSEYDDFRLRIITIENCALFHNWMTGQTGVFPAGWTGPSLIRMGYYKQPTIPETYAWDGRYEDSSSNITFEELTLDCMLFGLARARALDPDHINPLSPFYGDRGSNRQQYYTWRHILKSASGQKPWSDALLEIIYSKIINEQLFFGDAITIPYNFEFAVMMPKNDSASVNSAILLTTAITVATTAVAFGASVLAKKAICKSRAINEAKVAKAHEDLVSNPSPEAYKAYKKAAFKNNLMANINGGTKFDYINYWNGDYRSESDEDSSTSKLASVITTSSDESLSYSDSITSEIYRKMTGDIFTE